MQRMNCFFFSRVKREVFLQKQLLVGWIMEVSNNRSIMLVGWIMSMDYDWFFEKTFRATKISFGKPT